MVGVKAAVAIALLGSVQGARIARKKRSSCGAKGGSSNRNASISIVNGEAASECEWKWQVGFVQSEWDDVPFCGGTLIDPEWVFTAAHCGNKADFVVVAGDYDTRVASSHTQKRKAIRVFNHPNYNDNTMDFDFSLVKVDSPFDMTSCVGTACLPTEDVKAGSTCWITGWGTLSSGGNQPHLLQEVAVDILSNADCKRTDYGSDEITDSMLCAQGLTVNGKVADACQGDSGGPLVCESAPNVWTLHGATSWGYGCADANAPGIWARVNEVLDWADDVMAGLLQPPPSCPGSWCSSYCWYEPCQGCAYCY